MSGALPTSPNFKTIGLKSICPSFIDVAQSARRNARKSDFHLWEFTARYAKMTEAQFRPIWAFLLSQYGPYDTFTVIPTDTATPQGEAGGSPTVSSNTANTITIAGGSTSQTDWLKAGDILTIAGDTKVYVATADVDTDGAGAATITLFPDLFETPGGSAAVTLSNVAYTVHLKNGIQQYGLEPGPFYDFELDFVEAVS